AVAGIHVMGVDGGRVAQEDRVGRVGFDVDQHGSAAVDVAAVEVADAVLIDPQGMGFFKGTGTVGRGKAVGPDIGLYGVGQILQVDDQQTHAGLGRHIGIMTVSVDIAPNVVDTRHKGHLSQGVVGDVHDRNTGVEAHQGIFAAGAVIPSADVVDAGRVLDIALQHHIELGGEIGRASCRETVCVWDTCMVD